MIVVTGTIIGVHPSDTAVHSSPHSAQNVTSTHSGDGQVQNIRVYRECYDIVFYGRLWADSVPMP